MELQTEEQQVEALKAWWQENARAVMTGVAIAVLAVGGFRYWTHYQQQQAEVAADLFMQLDVTKTTGPEDAGRRLIGEYPHSAYAAFAALELAERAVTAGDLPAAEVQLRWAADNASIPELQQLAQVRLARVLVAIDKAQEAVTLLKGGSFGAYQGMADEARGDALAALGETEQAREAYQQALTAFDGVPAKRSLIEMKVDDLAGVAS